MLFLLAHSEVNNIHELNIVDDFVLYRLMLKVLSYPKKTKNMF